VLPLEFGKTDCTLLSRPLDCLLWALGLIDSARLFAFDGGAELFAL
jgi:hypothetical protein